MILTVIFKSSIAFFWHAQSRRSIRRLNTCTKHNWVDSEIVYQSDKPNKKVFHITDEGRLELNRWLADADLEDIMKYKNPLLIKIFFPAISILTRRCAYWRNTYGSVLISLIK